MQKKYIIPTILFIVLIIGGGSFYLYHKYFSYPAASDSTETDKAYMTFNNGDYGSSVESLRSLATTASKADSGRIQLLLASALYARNQGNDSEEAISILKKITDDYSISPMIRALAFNNIARTVLDHDVAFYVAHFTNEPLRSYISATSASSTQIDTAYYKILQLSDETYPNSYAEYSIAGNYFPNIITNGTLTQTEKERDGKLMQQYVKEGDSRNDLTIYSTATVLYGLLYRALAINTSEGVFKNVPPQYDESSYTKVLDYGAQLEKSGNPSVNTTLSQSALLRARFWYATLLLTTYPGQRNTDIETLLKPFARSGVSGNPYLNLIHLKNTSSSSSIKQTALALAKISPEFRTFLISTGVQVK